MCHRRREVRRAFGALVDALADAVCPPECGFFHSTITIRQKGTIPMIETSMNNDQFATIKLTPTTIAGRPTQLDGPATFTVQESDPNNPSGVTVTPNGALECRVDVPDEFVGDIDILAQGDAAFGPDVASISEVFRFHVQHPNAANLGGSVTLEDRP